jgi:uncharacterized LabA/DUF88 family protein
LLIDGDNVTSKVIARLIAELANYSTTSVRRIYEDWTSPQLSSWKAYLMRHSITPIQQFSYTTRKNATDDAMIIDAIDLLYTSRFSSFCIVSSDSDFTRLTARIREQGVTVYSFGERKTNSAFITTYDKFMYFNALSSEPEETHPTPKQGTEPVISASQITKRPLDRAALLALAKAVANSTNYEDNWVTLDDVGSRLSKISPDLQARNYRYRRLQDFIEASGVVDIKIKTIGSQPSTLLMRLKEKPGT